MGSVEPEEGGGPGAPPREALAAMVTAGMWGDTMTDELDRRRLCALIGKLEEVVASLEESPLGDAARGAYVLERAHASIRILADRLAAIVERHGPTVG